LSHPLTAYRATVLAALAFVAVAGSGCGKYQNALGDEFPRAVSAETLPIAVGVKVDRSSREPTASPISAVAVVADIADRLAREGVFSEVVFPYVAGGQQQVAMVFDVRVVVEHDEHEGENIGKAFLIGMTVFLLTPVLPLHYSAAVDVDVAARTTSGRPVGSYAYRSEYDFYFRSLIPSERRMDEWLARTKDHAVLEVVNQIERDRNNLAEKAGAEPASPSP